MDLRVEEFTQSLDSWEPQLLRSLTENRQQVVAFDQDCNEAFGRFRGSLETQYRATEDYERRVATRMEEFETRVMQEELIGLEKERDQKEKEGTRRIIEFNFKVS